MISIYQMIQNADRTIKYIQNRIVCKTVCQFPHFKTVTSNQFAGGGGGKIFFFKKIF